MKIYAINNISGLEHSTNWGAPTSEWGWSRRWIRAYSPNVAVFLIESYGTTVWVMCLKDNIILCNSAKTFFLPAYHGFECWYANTHYPMTHSPKMLPTPSDFASPKRPRLHRLPSSEMNPHSNCDDQ